MNAVAPPQEDEKNLRIRSSMGSGENPIVGRKSVDKIGGRCDALPPIVCAPSMARD